ncbi:helix-turn-helix domain-containing protein [Flavitalea flava]
MIIKCYRPTGILESFIESFLFVKSGSAISHSFYPETSVVLSFTLSGKHHYTLNNTENNMPPVAVAGIRRTHKEMHLSKGTETLLVKFKETGAASFFTQPIHEFFQTSVSLTDIYPRQSITNLQEKLARAPTDRLRLERLQTFLLSAFTNKKPDPLVVAAVERIHYFKGNIKIQELCLDLNISLDAFEKRFRRIVGASPKQFCFIIRMKNAVGALNRLKKQYIDVAFDLGYFDQTHFIKDFKLFTGQTPSSYLRSEISRQIPPIKTTATIFF